MNSEKNILQLLKDKSCIKQKVYKITKDVFSKLQEALSDKAKRLNNLVSNSDVDVIYSESGDFDAKLKFSGDTLLFHMHTNVFDCSSCKTKHTVAYIKEDRMRSFCGVINIYNFLSDSLKYNRVNDSGFLIARIFINKDRHFFVDGDNELGSLFDDFQNQIISNNKIDSIINSVMEHSLNFDLESPEFNDVRIVSVYDILEINNNHKLKTSKRLGFKFTRDINN
jgi:hypothetical protein